jgi:hypothetical protein
MADNLSLNSGTGPDKARTLDRGSNVHTQVAQIDIGGSAGESLVRQDNPMPTALSGEAVEALEAMRMAVQALTRTIGQMQPDTAARMRVAVDSITAGLTLATITTVGTVTTISTLTNQTQIGGLAATEQIPSLMRLGADSLRRNISVT